MEQQSADDNNGKAELAAVRNMFSDAKLDESLRNYLIKVYLSIATMIGAAALGCVLFRHSSEFWLSVSFFLCLFMMVYIRITNNPDNPKTCFFNLLVFGLSVGGMISPITELAKEVDPMIIPIAFAWTAGIFAILTVIAFKAPSFQFIALGGILSTALFGLCVLGFANLFLCSEFLFGIEIYGGLLVFVAMVLYDTRKCTPLSCPDSSCCPAVSDGCAVHRDDRQALPRRK